MENKSLQEKIRLFCDLNEIAYADRYNKIIPLVEDKKFLQCIAWNTNDFLIYGIRDLAHCNIDDEEFFQIWDITSHRPLKQERPHLHAVEKILDSIQEHTLYVVDAAAKIAYEHIHWSREKVDSMLKEKHATIVAI